MTPAHIPSPTGDLIVNYLRYLRVCNRSPRTIQARCDILTRIDLELPYGLWQATEDEIMDWVFRDDWSTQTKATYLGALKSFYGWAVGRVLDFNPTLEIPMPKVPARVPRPVTDGQLRLILTTAHEPYRWWALLAAYLGARCLEIARLTRQDITPQVTYLTGKGDKQRAVPTDRDVWTVAQSLPPGPVATVEGVPVDERYISIRFAIYCRRQLLLPGVGMHRLRHWYLTKVTESSGDPRLAQVLAGHSSLNTTMGYLQVAGGRMRTAVDSLPRLSGVAAAADAPHPSA